MYALASKGDRVADPRASLSAQSLMALGCMEHRGGCSADNDSGDGAGLLTNVPWELFKRDLPDLKEAHTGCDR